MKILYTGASKQDAVQSSPDLSLGGMVSGSQIPNDSMSNIFSAASILSIQNKRREVKMIAFKNDDGDTDFDLSFTFAKEIDSICKYKVAFVSPTISGDCSVFEQIINSAALPIYATFIEVVDGSIVNIESLAANAYLGVWLMREFDYTSDDLKKKSCADWLAKLEAIDIDPDVGILNTEEHFSFKLDYTIGEPSVSNSSSL